MIKHPKLLSTASEIKELAQKLSQSNVIAFDTEFIRENTFFPVVEIIQVATDSESWLIDAAAFKKGHRAGVAGAFDPAIQPLLHVFANKAILKIVHAAQGDQECLYTSFGAVASPTFDTSVGASLCGYGDSVGLGRLLKLVLDVTIGKGHARTNWSVRPLPAQLMDYAHADVEFLVSLGKELLSRLEKLGRKSWALELSAKWEDPMLYQIDVEGIARKLGRGGKLDKRGYSALLELVRWREDRVRHLNLPRRWVADDAVLVDLATVRPKDIEHLSSFRGLNKGELAKSGQAILEALARGAKAAETVVPPRAERLEAPSLEESQVLDLVKCYVGILADRHRIAAKHLMTTSQLLALLRHKIEAPQDLVKHEILSEDAARLIGAELIAFLAGKRGLFIEHNGQGSRIGIMERGGERS
ncbi:MAG: HRDC domain-containing protein [Oligoflexia bacterium]|nr:HRDC domain-containing protein [Oligoflexia bacterium]